MKKMILTLGFMTLFVVNAGAVRAAIAVGDSVSGAVGGGVVGRELSYDDIESGVFTARVPRGMNHCADGKHYTTLESGGVIVRHSYVGGVVDTVFSRDMVTGVFVGQGQEQGCAVPIWSSAVGNNAQGQLVLGDVAGYSLNSDESMILLWSDVEPIYRHSFRANYWLYDVYKRTLRPLSANGKQQVATLSPDSRKVAFVRDNNLYVVDLRSTIEKQITTDGQPGQVINGLSDWVYEEEYGFDQAYQWSPSSDAIAFYRFDESGVKSYSMNTFNGGLYPVNQDFKYPKAGEKNSFVQIKIYSLASGVTLPVEIGSDMDQYIPLIEWTRRPNCLAVHRLNRLQNSYQMLFVDAASGKSGVIYSEQSDRYVDRIDRSKVTFLADGKRFIVRSEIDGWFHLYLYDMTGRQIRRLTKGAWEVTAINAVDVLGGKIYYTSTERSPLERHMYSIDFKGGNKRLMTPQSGTYNCSMGVGARYAICAHSSVEKPTVVAIYDTRTGGVVRTLEDNAAVVARVAEYDMPQKRFFSFVTPSGVELNGYMLLPADFDSTRNYPLLMTQYSGPGSQSVANRWEVGWESALLREGMLVACVDGRGTGFRGAEFRNCTYRNLGRLEMEDQRDAAIYLGGLPYVDAGRVAIFGWSFGGFMALNCILQQADVFKAAIAVAPVTSWRFYDTIYTELYNGLPQDNAAGYDLNSPIFYADSLRGKLLLAHGTGDDNVHIQNSYEMITKFVEAGKDFELMIYPDKNHGMDPGGNRHHLFRKSIDFLKRSL